MSVQNKTAIDASPAARGSAWIWATVLAFVFAAYLIVAGWSHPIDVAFQNDAVAILFIIAAIGHFRKRSWAYLYTSILVAILIVGAIMLPRVMGEKPMIGLLPNLILVLLWTASHRARAKPAPAVPAPAASVVAPVPAPLTVQPISQAGTPAAKASRTPREILVGQIALWWMAILCFLLSAWIHALVRPFLGSQDPSMAIARTGGPLLSAALAMLGVFVIVVSFKKRD